MPFILIVLYLVILSLPLSAGNMHTGTSANPKTGQITLKLLGSPQQVFLDAPGVTWKKYPSGELQELSFTSLDNVYLVTFYSIEEAGKKEQIRLVQKFRAKGRQLVLHDKSQTFDSMGNLMCEMNYNDGVFDGPQKVYNRFGIVTEERYYEFGFPVKQWITRYDDGKTAFTVDFPEAVSDWESTYHAGNAKDKSILGLGYSRPVKIQEKWYNPEGFLQKEVAYNGILCNEKLEIKLLPDSKSYDRYGNVVAETRKEGQALIRSSWITKFGTCQEIESVYIGDELFKTRSEILKTCK